MKKQTQILTKNILEFKYGSSGEADPAFLESEHMKNVCAKLHVLLVDELDKAVSTMQMSKRAFIQMAIENSLSEYKELCKELDITGQLREDEEDNKKFQEYLKSKGEKS